MSSMMLSMSPLCNILNLTIAGEDTALRVVIIVPGMKIDKGEIRDILQPEHSLMEAESLSIPLSHPSLIPQFDLIPSCWNPSLTRNLRFIELIL